MNSSMQMATREARPTSHELRGAAGAVVAKVAAREPVALVVGGLQEIGLQEIVRLEMVRGIDPGDKGLAGDHPKDPVVLGAEGEMVRDAKAIVVRCDPENEARGGRMPTGHLLSSFSPRRAERLS